jgi:hypothetical protein
MASASATCSARYLAAGRRSAEQPGYRSARSRRPRRAGRSRGRTGGAMPRRRRGWTGRRRPSPCIRRSHPGLHPLAARRSHETTGEPIRPGSRITHWWSSDSVGSRTPGAARTRSTMSRNVIAPQDLVHFLSAPPELFVDQPRPHPRGTAPPATSWLCHLSETMCSSRRRPRRATNCRGARDAYGAGQCRVTERRRGPS